MGATTVVEKLASFVRDDYDAFPELWAVAEHGPSAVLHELQQLIKENIDELSDDPMDLGSLLWEIVSDLNAIEETELGEALLAIGQLVG